MALFASGQTMCGFCGSAVSQDDVFAFPPFVANERDPLFGFNDVVAHRTCLVNDPVGHQAVTRLEAVRRLATPMRRHCGHCNTPITDPDDWIGFGCLTVDVHDPLYRYNNLEMHRACLSGWRELRRALAEFREASDCGRWAGRTIEHWIHTLEQAEAIA